MKTADLTGSALNWAVAIADGWESAISEDNSGKHLCLIRGDRYMRLTHYHPSTNWGVGGAIIERERICVVATPSAHWDARTPDYPPRYISGATPLIAAMRCYVASKLGDDVNVPEELIK